MDASRAQSKKEQDSLLLRMRTDRQDTLTQRLSLALSTRRSDKAESLLATPTERDAEEAYSPSSNSTVSSSGEVEGVYTLQESDLADSEFSTGDEESGGCGQDVT